MSEPALGNNLVMQVAIIVRDIEAKSKAWSEILGLPLPNIIITDTWDKTRAEYLGAPTNARSKLAFFDMGQLNVELIEPIDAPSTWQQHLDERGEGLHHIAFEIQGMGEKLAYLDSKGIPLIQRGEYKGGRYAYVDGMNKLGTVLELLEND
jgi:catechol 2,3-dioxygenase-like lactoylglutathione lyase family enzyme